MVAHFFGVSDGALLHSVVQKLHRLLFGRISTLEPGKKLSLLLLQVLGLLVYLLGDVVSTLDTVVIKRTGFAHVRLIHLLHIKLCQILAILYGLVAVL